MFAKHFQILGWKALVRAANYLLLLLNQRYGGTGSEGSLKLLTTTLTLEYHGGASAPHWPGRG